MVEVQQTRDTCVDHLTVTSGVELEIMANLKSVSQVDAVLEGYICKALGSAFGWGWSEGLLRTSISVGARARDDLTGIGKTPDTQLGFSERNRGD
jgi:hypothetical protein